MSQSAKIEYRVESYNGTFADHAIKQWLDARAKMGWELVSVLPAPPPLLGFKCFFKKQIRMTIEND